MIIIGVEQEKVFFFFGNEISSNFNFNERNLFLNQFQYQKQF